MPAFYDLATVQDPAVNVPVTEAWFDGVRDLLQYLGTNAPHCRSYNTANESISNATFTVVTMDTDRVDVGNCHSTVSNTGRFANPDGGWTLCTGHIKFPGNATGIRGVYLRLNGTTYIAVTQNLNDGAADDWIASVVTAYQFAPGDYFEIVVYQSSGGALNVAATGNFSPEGTLTWLRT